MSEYGENEVMSLNRIITIAVITLALTLSANAHATTSQSQEAALMRTVQSFYGWVLKHGEETRQQFEPRITQVQGNTRLVLDLSSLDKYSDAIIASGCFAPEFRLQVAHFYERSAQDLHKYSQSDFDEMAKDGRGPLIDSEDTDVFFCSQEAEYTPTYIAGAHLKKADIKGDTATAVVVTPDKWKNYFTFRKIKDKWLISGFCLYK